MNFDQNQYDYQKEFFTCFTFVHPFYIFNVMRRGMIRLNIKFQMENHMKGLRNINWFRTYKSKYFFLKIGNIFKKPINVSSCTKIVYIMLRKI